VKEAPLFIFVSTVVYKDNILLTKLRHIRILVHVKYAILALPTLPNGNSEDHESPYHLSS
jgi:hypothetical protein